MLKIYQDEFGKILPESTTPVENGNCFNACLASIIEVPLKLIPRFQDIPKVQWLTGLTQILIDNGYVLSGMSFDEAPEGYSIAAGYNKGGKLEHCCVYLNGKLFHDPDPNSNGLEIITQYFIIKKANKSKNVLVKNLDEENKNK